ncbi:MAG: pilus assembly protein [Elusimicrobiota bacterium]|nr:pilus assembly protein [Elusimicrobiota bacterium]
MNNSGQAMVEAVFSILFTTIIMFGFLQVCIIIVDDMTANEAAFRAMRSAAVAGKSERSKVARDWAKKHLRIFYPMAEFDEGGFLSSFVLSTNDEVKEFFNRTKGSQETETPDISSNEGITLWHGSKTTKDFSGKSLSKQTVKIYYFTKVMFGKLIAPKNSKDNVLQSGAKRYQSARSRMFPSPDEDFYYKAYPDGKRFEDSVGSIH